MRRLNLPRDIVILGIAILPSRAAKLPAASPTLEGCPVFPANNIWNTPVDQLPVAARSQDYINSIGPNVRLHPDFGSGTWEGIRLGSPITSSLELNDQ